MPSIISLGDKLIRINFDNNRIEQSHTGGRTWITWYSGSFCGTFIDLLEFEDEIVALTDRGIFCSTNEGASWRPRCSSPIARSLTSLQDGGGEIIGKTDDGHIYASKNNGAIWVRRR